MRGLLVSCLVWSFVSIVSAQGLRVDHSQERMRVDGSLREWKGARFASFGSGEDAALKVALATADGGLYLGAEVADESVVREASVGGKQDALVLTLAMPQDAGLSVIELSFYPGKAGKKAAGAVALEGKAIKPEPRIKVVEGPREAGEGYVIEAFVPWAIVPGAELWEQGRAALRFEDADESGRIESVVRSSETKRKSDLPRLLMGEGQDDKLGAFLASQQLSGVEPRFDFRGNVSGDNKPERVVIVDKFVVAYGPGYKKGEAYGYFTMPFGSGGGLKSASLSDVTGDGTQELLLVLRQGNELGARELWMVLSFAGEDPKPMFAIELRKEVRGGFVENALSLNERVKGPARIRVKTGKGKGLSAANYRESPASDAQAILLPWGEVSSRTYQFDGSTFAVVEEQKQAPEIAPVAASKTESDVVVNEGPMVAPDVADVVALFKKEAKRKADEEPTKSLVANVFDGDGREHVMLFGTTLLIAGGDLGGGGSYMAYGLPVQTADAVRYIGLGDVTGDGVREIFVRIQQPLGGGSAPVHRELALVLRFDGLGRLGRALALDVTRRQGAQVIANRVRTRGGVLTVLPGTAEGWDASNYPFTNEATGGAERLLLPWADQPVRYRLEGERFVVSE